MAAALPIAAFVLHQRLHGLCAPRPV